MRFLHCLALLLLISSSTLAQKKKQNGSQAQRNREREEDALETYYIQQAALNKEQEGLLRYASEEALTVVKKVEKASNRAKEVAIIADLWENAKGVVVVKSLAILLELTPKKTTYYYAVNSDAMDMAENNGYGFKVSEALYNAMAVTDSDADHYHLLDALLYRMEEKEKKDKGSGCQYVEFLFTDAEAWAIEDGRTQHFFRGFDHADYLPITECFLPVCKGTAAKCCGNKKAVSTGLCECKVINKKENTMQCEHNLFSTAPRTVWLCGTSDCQLDEKCLCPTAKDLKKSQNKSEKSKPKDEKPKAKSNTSKSKGKGQKATSKKGKGKKT